MTRLIIAASLVLISVFPVFAEKDFVSWWKSVNTPEQFRQGEHQYYRRLLSLKFMQLQEYRGRPQKPKTIRKGIEKIFLLNSDKGSSILLAMPKNIMKGKEAGSEEYYALYDKCSHDKSWVVLLPENTWTEVDVNPYCSESYGEDEVDVLLYWVAGSDKPFLEFITNGPACIPVKLYGWERKTKKYRLMADKCTG